MCKFCKGESTFGRSGQKIFMNDNGQLVYLGENGIFGEVIGKIKYCPLCGKKIEVEKEKG
jgi:hypothetical protein